MTSPSAAKLIPGNPAAVMVIRDLTPDLTTLSVPFLRFGRLKVGGRSTIIRLQSGNLAVFSPVALTPEVQSHLSSRFGPDYSSRVKYLAALDIEHHIFLSPWSKAFPQAELIGMEGLPEKRAKDPATADAKFAHVLTKANKLSYKIGGDFDREFSYEYVDAHGNKELVFFHRPSGTVIEADLIFNLPATEQYSRVPGPEGNVASGFANRLVNAIENTRGSAVWQKRFVYYLAAGKDRKGMAESVSRMDAWKNEGMKRLIPCHGDVIEGEREVGEVWSKMFEWFRGLEKKGS